MIRSARLRTSGSSWLMKGSSSNMIGGHPIFWKNALEYIHVPPGEYTLHLKVDNFSKYEHGPFTIEDGQTMDLGKIPLVPADMLIIKLVKPGGEPFNGMIGLEFQTKMRGSRGSDRVKNGILCIDGGPGKYTVKLKAEDYKEEEITAELEEGESKEIKVVLRPEI